MNEELGATAVWGTQQLDLYPKTNKYDGVFGIWYGKGPGVDRSGDVFKHANMAGTAKHGGVIAIAGDDHISKSSTAAHQSDHIFKACGLPVFFPSDVQGILDMGLHALALSRFSGAWVGFKAISEVVESGMTVHTQSPRLQRLRRGVMELYISDHPLDCLTCRTRPGSCKRRASRCGPRSRPGRGDRSRTARGSRWHTASGF